MKRRQGKQVVKSLQSLLDEQFQKDHCESTASFPSISSRYFQLVRNHAEISRSKNMVHNYHYKEEENNTNQRPQQSDSKNKKGRNMVEEEEFKCGACKHIYKSYDSLESHILNDHKTYQHLQTKDKKPSKSTLSTKMSPKIMISRDDYPRQKYFYLFPKELSNVLPKEHLHFLNNFINLKSLTSQQKDAQITLSYFIAQIKEILTYKNMKLSFMTISHLLAVFLHNLKESINIIHFPRIQIFFYEFIIFINSSYRRILERFRSIAEEFVDIVAYERGDGYCSVERAYLLDVFIEEYLICKVDLMQLQRQLLLSLKIWVKGHNLDQFGLMNHQNTHEKVPILQ